MTKPRSEKLYGLVHRERERERERERKIKEIQKRHKENRLKMSA